MRGRRAEPPELQAAKGNPRQRGQGGVAARLKEAARIARLLAEAPSDGDALAPPKFLDDRFAGALTVWRNLGPRLRETHRLSALHRPTFALFCVYYAEWVSCNDDIAQRGFYQIVPMTNGIGNMERIRPAVKVREIAFANVMELAKHFGLTPAEEYSLMKDQRMAAERNPELFDGQQPAQDATAQVEPEAPAPQARSLVGGLASLDSMPPASLKTQ